MTQPPAMTTEQEVAASSAPPPPRVASLSPSRASDFKTCPLLYRFRTIDRLPERPSPLATRGSVVHAVLERLFDLPPQERLEATARAMVGAEWDRLTADDPELAGLFADEPAELETWLASAMDLVSTYFGMEDPTRIEPAAREQLVEAELDSGLLLRGYVDRLDEASDGRVRIVDYKTGTSPRVDFEAKALFQMKFYALVLWRSRGVVPAQLKLIYLSDRDTLSYAPDEDELLALERQLMALWLAVERALETQDFRPRPSRMCTWCDYKERCPAWGGVLPDFPEHAVMSIRVDRRVENAAAD